MSAPVDWTVPSKRDPQSVTPDWEVLHSSDIDGVVIKEVRNVVTSDGYLSELYRTDWKLDDVGVGQVFQRYLEPGAVSAWHAHAVTTDRLACAFGRILVVLYDARKGSPSHGVVTEVRMGAERPTTVVVPPGVWHGVRCLGSNPGVLVNVVDVAYAYEQPDHWRAPADSPDIPYKFV